MKLQENIELVQQICWLLESEQEYTESLTQYLPILNQTIYQILQYAQDTENSFNINEQYVLQVLRDIMYGIEHSDSVILLDVFRYGLIPMYSYTIENL